MYGKGENPVHFRRLPPSHPIPISQQPFQATPGVNVPLPSWSGLPSSMLPSSHVLPPSFQNTTMISAIAPPYYVNSNLPPYRSYPDPSPALPAPQLRFQGENSNVFKIFVNNLPQGTTSVDLKNMFQRVSPVLDINVYGDGALVEFEDMTKAMAVVRAFERLGMRFFALSTNPPPSAFNASQSYYGYAAMVPAPQYDQYNMPYLDVQSQLQQQAGRFPTPTYGTFNGNIPPNRNPFPVPQPASHPTYKAPSLKEVLNRQKQNVQESDEIDTKDSAVSKSDADNEGQGNETCNADDRLSGPCSSSLPTRIGKGKDVSSNIVVDLADKEIRTAALSAVSNNEEVAQNYLERADNTMRGISSGIHSSAFSLQTPREPLLKFVSKLNEQETSDFDFSVMSQNAPKFEISYDSLFHPSLIPSSSAEAATPFQAEGCFSMSNLSNVVSLATAKEKEEARSQETHVLTGTGNENNLQNNEDSERNASDEKVGLENIAEVKEAHRRQEMQIEENIPRVVQKKESTKKVPKHRHSLLTWALEGAKKRMKVDLQIDGELQRSFIELEIAFEPSKGFGVITLQTLDKDTLIPISGEERKLRKVPQNDRDFVYSYCPRTRQGYCWFAVSDQQNYGLLVSGTRVESESNCELRFFETDFKDDESSALYIILTKAVAEGKELLLHFGGSFDEIIQRRLKHVCSIASKVKVGSFSCRKCFKQFRVLEELQQHLREHKASSNRGYPLQSCLSQGVEKKEIETKSLEKTETFGSVFDELPPPKTKNSRSSSSDTDGVKVNLIASCCSERPTDPCGENVMLPSSTQNAVSLNGDEIEGSRKRKVKVEGLVELESLKRRKVHCKETFDEKTNKEEEQSGERKEEKEEEVPFGKKNVSVIENVEETSNVRRTRATKSDLPLSKGIGLQRRKRRKKDVENEDFKEEKEKLQEDSKEDKEKVSKEEREARDSSKKDHGDPLDIAKNSGITRKIIMNREMRNFMQGSKKKENPADLFVMDDRDSLPPLTRSQLHAWDLVTQGEMKKERKCQEKESEREVEGKLCNLRKDEVQNEWKMSSEGKKGKTKETSKIVDGSKSESAAVYVKTRKEEGSRSGLERGSESVVENLDWSIGVSLSSKEVESKVDQDAPYSVRYAHIFDNFFLEKSSFPLISRPSHPKRAFIFPRWENGSTERNFAMQSLKEERWVHIGDESTRKDENSMEKLARKKRDWSMFYRRHGNTKKEKSKAVSKIVLNPADRDVSTLSKGEMENDEAMEELLRIVERKQRMKLSRLKRKEKELKEKKTPRNVIGSEGKPLSTSDDQIQIEKEESSTLQKVPIAEHSSENSSTLYQPSMLNSAQNPYNIGYPNPSQYHTNATQRMRQFVPPQSQNYAFVSGYPMGVGANLGGGRNVMNLYGGRVGGSPYDISNAYGSTFAQNLSGSYFGNPYGPRTTQDYYAASQAALPSLAFYPQSLPASFVNVAHPTLRSAYPYPYAPNPPAQTLTPQHPPPRYSQTAPSSSTSIPSQFFSETLPISPPHPESQSQSAPLGEDEKRDISQNQFAAAPQH